MFCFAADDDFVRQPTVSAVADWRRQTFVAVCGNACGRLVFHRERVCLIMRHHSKQYPSAAAAARLRRVDAVFACVRWSVGVGMVGQSLGLCLPRKRTAAAAAMLAMLSVSVTQTPTFATLWLDGTGERIFVYVCAICPIHSSGGLSWPELVALRHAEDADGVQWREYERTREKLRTLCGCPSSSERACQESQRTRK